MDDPARFLWLAAASFAALGAFAAWRDHARARRRNIDKVGLMPWSLILVMAMLLAIVCGALAVLV